MRQIVIPASCPALQYVCALSHTRECFRKTGTEHKTRVLIFSTTLKHFSVYEEMSKYDQKSNFQVRHPHYDFQYFTIYEIWQSNTILIV